jgi:septal ring factor EnvC (AmiA/AmiB activator)
MTPGGVWTPSYPRWRDRATKTRVQSVADTISLNVRRTPMSDGVTHFADDATLKRLRELEAEIQALELNRVMDRQQIDILKDDAASQQDRFLRCVKTRKDLADKCDKLEAENAELNEGLEDTHE